MKEDPKKLFLFAAVAFFLIILLRIPFYNPIFYEGDDAAIAAGIQCWIRGGEFQNVPLYRNHFQFGTYYLIYFLSIISGSNALSSFYLLVFFCGTLFSVAVSTWFTSIARLSEEWVIVTSILVILLPEIFFTSTVYPNTSILSAAFVSTGFVTIWLSHPESKFLKYIFPSFLFSIAMALRLDALLMFLPIPFMIYFKSANKTAFVVLKEIIKIIGLIILFWLTGAIISDVDFHELYLSFYSHTQEHHTRFIDSLKVLYSGISMNIIFVFFTTLGFLLWKKLLHRKGWILLISFALPCCINFYHLTTPKYILPLYTIIALLISLSLHNLIINSTQKSFVYIGYILILTFSLHLWIGQDYNPETAQDEWVVLKPASPLRIMNHDGPRPNGSMFLSVLAINQGPMRFYNEFYNEVFYDISKSGYNIGMICQDWADWGLLRYFMAFHADNYTREGYWVEWKSYPEHEVFYLGNSTVSFYWNQWAKTYDYLLRDLPGFNRLIIPEPLAQGDSWDKIMKNWSISKTFRGRVLLAPNPKN